MLHPPRPADRVRGETAFPAGPLGTLVSQRGRSVSAQELLGRGGRDGGGRREEEEKGRERKAGIEKRRDRAKGKGGRVGWERKRKRGRGENERQRVTEDWRA